MVKLHYVCIMHYVLMSVIPGWWVLLYMSKRSQDALPSASSYIIVKISCLGTFLPITSCYALLKQSANMYANTKPKVAKWHKIR